MGSGLRSAGDRRDRGVDLDRAEDHHHVERHQQRCGAGQAVVGRRAGLRSAQMNQRASSVGRWPASTSVGPMKISWQNLAPFAPLLALVGYAALTDLRV